MKVSDITPLIEAGDVESLRKAGVAISKAIEDRKSRDWRNRDWLEEIRNERNRMIHEGGIPGVLILMKDILEFIGPMLWYYGMQVVVVDDDHHWPPFTLVAPPHTSLPIANKCE